MFQCLVEELGERREPCRGPADDGEHQGESKSGCADDRLRAAADADPCRERAELGVRDDILVAQRSAGLALPGDRSSLEQFGEELRLLFEEVVVVGKVVAKQWERLDAGTSSEDDLCPTAGDGVEGGVALEHPDWVIRAQHGYCRPEAYAGRPRRDGAQHYVCCRHREVVSVVLADPEELDAGLLGVDPLLDDVADRLSM